MRKLNESGMTLVEIAISVIVTGILLAVVFAFMTNSLVQYTNDTNRAELLNSAQVGFEKITNDIRLSANADTINRWPDANSPSGDFGWSSDSDTLLLATATEDSNGNIIFSDPANYISQKNNIIYYLQDSTLYRRVLAAPEDDIEAVTSCPPPAATETCPADSVILENIIEFSVTYIDEQNNEVSPENARAIELYAKLEKETFSEPVTIDYTTRMVFRND